MIAFRHIRFLLSIAGTAYLLGSASPTLASGLQISPTTLQLSAQQAAEGIWLSNSGENLVHAQVRVFSWTQKDGTDMLAPSTGLTISPPMLQLAPGNKQLIRVIQTGPTNVPGEVAYRVLIDELPIESADVDAPDAEPTAAKNANAARKALKFLLRYSVPVFVVNPAVTAQKIAPDLHWNIRNTDKQWTLTVKNTGNSRAQLADFEGLANGGKAAPLLKGLMGYVLPGSTMQWTLPAPVNGNTFTGFSAMINGDTQPVSIANAP